jgi:hypothetical protein
MSVRKTSKRKSIDKDTSIDDKSILNPQIIIDRIESNPKYNPKTPNIKTLLDIINNLNYTRDPIYTDDLIDHIDSVIVEYNSLKKTANECEIDVEDVEDIEDVEEEDRKCDRQLSDKIAEIHDYLNLILDVLKDGFVLEIKPSPIQINIKKCILLIERNLPGYQEDYSISKNPMELKGYTKQTYLVNGPVSFYIFVSPDQKKYIYLFGDVHTKESGCDGSKPFIKLQDLISNTIRIHSDKIIDVFLEKRNFEITSKEEKSFMSELNKYFNKDGCGLPYTSFSDKCKEKYPNARFHSADIRQFYISMPKLLEMLKSPTPDMKILESMTEKLVKQIDAVKDKSIRDRLYAIFKTIHADMHYKSDKLSPLMDVYLLSRLFRSYGDHEDKKVDFDNEDVNYAIVYTGNAHTDFYCKFLLSSGYDLLYEVNKTKRYTQCIEIPVLVDNETDAPFLGFGHDLKTPSKMRVKRRSSSHRKKSAQRIKKSKRGSARARRVKKSKSIPKKSKRGSARVRRVKKSKSITKSKSGSVGAPSFLGTFF